MKEVKSYMGPFAVSNIAISKRLRHGWLIIYSLHFIHSFNHEKLITFYCGRVSLFHDCRFCLTTSHLNVETLVL